MNNVKIKQMVHDYYEKGHHCAESIAMTIDGLFTKNKSENICRFASGFRGGIGGCKKDVCGALSGGIIALGSLFGRETGDKNIDKLCEMAWEETGTMTWNALTLIPFLKYHYSETLAKKLVEKSEGRPLSGG